MSSANGSSNGHSLDGEVSAGDTSPHSTTEDSPSSQSSDNSCSCTYNPGTNKKGKVCAKRATTRPARSINNVPHLSFDENFSFNVSLSLSLCFIFLSSELLCSVIMSYLTFSN